MELENRRYCLQDQLGGYCVISMKDAQTKAAGTGGGRKSRPTGGRFQGGMHMVCCLMDIGCEGRKAVRDCSDFSFHLVGEDKY